MPSSVEPYILVAEEPVVPSLDGSLKVRSHRNQDVDSHNHEREALEPVLLAYAPAVLDHHEAYTSRKGGIELGIMEPAVHIDIGLVLESPLCATGRSNLDCNKINRQNCRKGKEHYRTAKL